MNSFILSFKLKNAYRVNSIIYTLKHTPLINKLFSYSLYTSKGIKIFAHIISTIIEIVSIFIGKLFYLSLFFASFLSTFSNTSSAFINIFIFLTIIGGLLNTYIFNPSIDKYYAIVLMRFDAKEYTLSNYIYSLLKCLIGFLPFTIIFGTMFKVQLLICILLPFFVVSIKNIFNAYMLSSYKTTEKIKNENKFTSIVLTFVGIFLVLAYGLPYYNIGINSTLFYIIFLISLILGIISFIYIIKSNLYKRMCKDVLKKEMVIPNNNVEFKVYKNQISNEKISTDKTGYEYFNYIFVARHKKLLTRATKNISIGLSIFFALAVLVTILLPTKNKEINDILNNSIPYYLFVMYFINRGQKICQTMFMNCDRSMLTYRFYREKDAILSLFKERLKTLIKLNVVPGFIMSAGTLLLLYTTGGASIEIYVITFLTIIAMSIFFSVHYLVLYYLLQPYSVNLDIKNPAFMTICWVTYMVCYAALQIQIPIMIFGICMCLFTIVYSILSLLLAYKYAPKKFRLRV